MDRMPHPGLLVVRSGRNPYPVCLCVALVTILLYSLVFHATSRSLDDALSSWQQVAYSVIGVAASLFILFGLYRKNLLLGLLWERTGHLMLAGAFIIYLISLTQAGTPTRSGFVAALALSYTVAALWRSWQITRTEIPTVRRYLQERP